MPPARTRRARSRASRARRARARSRRSAPAARGGRPVSCSSDDGCVEEHGPRRHRRVPYPHREPAQTQVAVVGAGAAGLYTALCAARDGARGDARLGHAARRRRRATGPRAGSPPRSPRTTAPSSTSRTRSPPAAARCANRRPGSSARRRPRAVEDLAALGVDVRRRPPRPARARARGRPLGPPDRPRRRRRDRPADHPPAVGAGRRGRADRGARGPARDADPDRGTAAPSALQLDDGQILASPAPSSSPPAARPRCGRARPTPRARSAAGCCSPTRPALRWPTSS